MTSAQTSQNRSKTLSGFGVILIAGIFYLVDYALAHRVHPDIAWLKSGIYAGGFFGVEISLCLAVFGFIYGAYHAIKSIIEEK